MNMTELEKQKKYDILTGYFNKKLLQRIKKQNLQ